MGTSENIDVRVNSRDGECGRNKKIFIGEY